MRKISTIIIMLFAGILASALGACKSQPYQVSDTPQYFMGNVKYTGPVFSPFGSKAPYTFAFYDINNTFVAYMDFSNVLMSNMEPFLNKPVTVRGMFTEDGNGDFVIRADNIKLSK